MSQVPKIIYRGIVLNSQSAREYKYIGDSIRLKTKPVKAADGNEILPNGNEYGIYMTGHKDIAVENYARRYGKNRKILSNRNVLKPNALQTNIYAPSVGVVFEINTNGLNVKIPKNYTGFAENEGHFGHEWISKEPIPQKNYRISDFYISENLLFDETHITVTNIVKDTARLMQIIKQRETRTKIFIQEVIDKIPGNDRIVLSQSQIDIYKKIYGEEGVRFIDYENKDIKTEYDKLMYIFAKEYRKDTKNLDMRSLGILVDIEKELKNPKNNKNLESLLLDKKQKKTETRDNYVNKQNKDGGKQNTYNFDRDIESINNFIEDLRLTDYEDERENE